MIDCYRELLFIFFILFTFFIFFCIKYKIVNVNDKKWNIKEIPMYCLYIPKRKEQVTKFFNDINLNVEYVQGPDKNTLDMNEFKEKGLIADNCKNSAIDKQGALACTLGHISILEKFIETQEEWCIIFEDDVNSRFNESEIVYLIEQTFNNLPIDCDILFLGYCYENCSKVRNVYNSYSDFFNNKPNIYVKTGNSASCAHSYVVNRKCAKKILDNTRPMYYIPSDDIVQQLLLTNKLVGYLSTYVIFEQNLDDFESELGTSPRRPVCGMKNNIVYY